MSITETSRFIAYILRHKPGDVGITLNEHGWANVDELIAGVSKSYPLDMDMPEEIVRADNKQRYSFNEDQTLIRTNQGHSIPVDVELPQMTPPEILYHGTGVKYQQSIDAKGLLPMSRLYVHMSENTDTPRMVGVRRGSPVIYIVHSGDMARMGLNSSARLMVYG